MRLLTSPCILRSTSCRITYLVAFKYADANQRMLQSFNDRSCGLRHGCISSKRMRRGDNLSLSPMGPESQNPRCLPATVAGGRLRVLIMQDGRWASMSQNSTTDRMRTTEQRSWCLCTLPGFHQRPKRKKKAQSVMNSAVNLPP